MAPSHVPELSIKPPAGERNAQFQSKKRQQYVLNSSMWTVRFVVYFFHYKVIHTLYTHAIIAGVYRQFGGILMSRIKRVYTHHVSFNDRRYLDDLNIIIMCILNVLLK